MSLEYGDVTNFLDFCPPKVNFREACRGPGEDKDVEVGSSLLICFPFLQVILNLLYSDA